MASYNPYTDDIGGAKRSSLLWWHERGHQKTRGLGLLTLNLFPHLIIVSLGCLAYGLPLGARVCFWVWVGLSLLNELIAWAYAIWFKLSIGLLFDWRTKP